MLFSFKEAVAAGVVFTATWEDLTGSGDSAITEAGNWDTIYCSGTTVMSVVAGSGHDWTATTNVLQIVNQGSSACKNIETSESIPQEADDYYIRMYIRLENVGVTEEAGTGHTVSIGTTNIQGTTWAISDPVADTSYKPRCAIAEKVGLATFGYAGPTLNQYEWYRFESHIEFYDEANPLRFRIWPYIYNMAGTLVGDADDYITNDFPNEASLADDYAAGGYGTVDDRDVGRQWQVGYEGTAGNDDVGGRWYYAAVEIRTDTFPGPLS